MEKLDSGKQAVVRLLKGSGLPVRTITTDNRTEFAAHETISRELGITVYFARPYCSWEKGAIENCNAIDLLFKVAISSPITAIIFMMKFLIEWYLWRTRLALFLESPYHSS
ncbi:hypothetical protein [Segatella oris]|jgi:IS30 family transposase|uniref:hypothetical protein n=1 Tax=Segatella oris TaxID=28135 RepID=UPI00241EABE1|nr:hypothetical protein [Segatella oris]